MIALLLSAGVPTLPVPTASASAAEPVPGCSTDDPRVAELSGLVTVGEPGVAPSAYRVIVDGGGPARVFTLDPVTCAVTGVDEEPVRVTDVEDLASGRDGSLWLADIGDNTAVRPSVRMVVLPPSGPPRVHELTYPDGPRDAEAVLVSDDGVPLVVAKSTGAAGVYRPATPLPRTGTDDPVPLVRVGEVILPYSATGGGPLGAAGSRTVTGGAVGPPGPDRAVALRTYTDAWLFPLPTGSADADALVGALRGAPLPVPLPEEAQGEAVALDGRGTLHSGTEARGTAPAAVRTVPGAAAAAGAPGAPVVGQPAVAPEGESFPPWLPAAAAGAAAAALLLGGVGAMLVHERLRRRRRSRSQ